MTSAVPGDAGEGGRWSGSGGKGRSGCLNNLTSWVGYCSSNHNEAGMRCASCARAPCARMAHGQPPASDVRFVRTPPPPSGTPFPIARAGLLAGRGGSLARARTGATPTCRASWAAGGCWSRSLPWVWRSTCCWWASRCPLPPSMPRPRRGGRWTHWRLGWRWQVGEGVAANGWGRDGCGAPPAMHWWAAVQAPWRGGHGAGSSGGVVWTCGGGLPASVRLHPARPA